MTKDQARMKLQELKVKLKRGDIKFEKYAAEKRKLKPFLSQEE